MLPTSENTKSMTTVDKIGTNIKAKESFMKDDLPGIHTATMLCVPYMNHDDANRLQMVNNHLRQALPLIHSDVPYVITGYEPSIVEYAQTFLVKPIKPGKVLNRTPITYSLALDITDDEYKELKKLIEEATERGQKTIKSDVLAHVFFVSNTWPTMHWFKKEDESFEAGEIIAYDKSFIQLARNPEYHVLGNRNAEPYIPYYKYGVTLWTAYMTFYGYNYQDAIVISESAAKKLTHIEKEYIIIPVHRSAVFKPIYDGLPLPLPGTKLDGTKPLCEYTIIHEKTLTTSTRRYAAPKGIVVDVYYDTIPGYQIKDKTMIAYISQLNKLIDYNKYRSLHNKKALTELPKQPNEHYPLIIKITVLKVRPAVVGDKLANRHGNKGVIGLIVPDEEMPYVDGNQKLRAEIIPSELSVPSRMNIGQLFEQLATKILKKVDALIRHYLKQKQINKAWHLYKNTVLYFLQNDKLLLNKVQALIERLESDTKFIAKYFALLYEDIGHILAIQRPYYGLKAEQLLALARKLKISEKDYMVVDGIRTSKPISFGPQYWQKLEHTRDSKITGSTIGPYNVYGETRKGQRIGEMETWNMYVQNMDLVHEELFTIRGDHFASKFEWLGNILVDDKEIVEYLVQVNTSSLQDTDDILDKFVHCLGINIRNLK